MMGFFFVSFFEDFFGRVFLKKGCEVQYAVGSSVVKFFYAHYFVSGKCHVVHSPNRAPCDEGLVWKRQRIKQLQEGG